MSVRSVLPRWGPGDRRSLVVRDEPIWTHLLGTVAAAACGLTGHRWCMSALSHWVTALCDRHSTTFVIPVDREVLAAYCTWAGVWNVDAEPDDDHDDNDLPLA